MKSMFVLWLTLGTLSGFAQKFTAEPLSNPSGDASLQANWSRTPDGRPLLSWIEPAKDGSYSLRYAERHGSSWSPTQTVATGRHFFRHPAEVPEVVAFNEHLWMSHWVEMPNRSSEAEFVYVSSSTDGVHWTTPVIAHEDRSAVQHGLASMVESGSGEISLIWLETPKGEKGPAYMMRSVLTASGKEIREERLDQDVCSCCPTSIVKTSKGLLVAYRDHTPGDIRDIAVMRFENGRWTQPSAIHADNWKLNACPTNAASAAATGNHVVISWFTAAQNSPRVQVVFSEDGGATFGKTVLASSGRAFGYTSTVLDEDGGAIVSWLEHASAGKAHILVRKVSPAGEAGPTVSLVEAGRQALGYPRVFHSSAGTFVAWGNSQPGLKIQTVRLGK